MSRVSLDNAPEMISCFGEMVSFAEVHGFVDDWPSGEEWSCDLADELEYEAIDYLVEKGISFMYGDDYCKTENEWIINWPILNPDDNL